MKRLGKADDVMMGNDSIILRMEEDRYRQAALRDRAGRPASDGHAGLWETWRSPAGERVRSFHDRHDDAK